MKRGGYIARKTPLKRAGMKRRPRKVRPAHLEDKPYREWIATLPCRAPGCTSKPPSHPHHHSLTGLRGTSQKPPDSYCMTLCFRSHRELHSLSGPFKGWTREQLKQWQDDRVAECRAAWSRAA